jgi:IMP dehydrogenase
MSSLKVEDYMTRDVITVAATDTVKHVISLIKSTKHDGFPVVKDLGQVKIQDLVPTQSKIFADELQGRKYELEKGLAEPLIVIKKRDKTLLVDGHHRAVAARSLNLKEIDAYIITMDRDVPLGMERTAENVGLRSLTDIRILESSTHPLIEITRRSGSRNV